MISTQKRIAKNNAVAQKLYAATKDPAIVPPRTMSFTGTYSGLSTAANRPGADDFRAIASRGVAAPQLKRSFVVETAELASSV